MTLIDQMTAATIWDFSHHGHFALLLYCNWMSESTDRSDAIAKAKWLWSVQVANCQWSEASENLTRWPINNILYNCFMDIGDILSRYKHI